MTADQIIDGILRREGGFVDNPDDKGGPTNFGITEAVARANGYDGPMVELQEAAARAIYEKRYISEPGFDKVLELNPQIGEELIDTGVNMGPRVAAVFLQRCLNCLNLKGEMYTDIVADGEIGPGTIGALKTFLNVRGKEGAVVLLKALNCLQGARYVELCEANVRQETFLYGWLRERIGI